MCAKDKLHLNRCPEFILNYKNCQLKDGKIPTFHAAPSPGMNKEDLNKECWNGKWYERRWKH